MGGKKRDIN